MATQAEITEIYRQVLGREPDAEGLAYWTQQLANAPLTTAVQNIVSAAQTADQPRAQQYAANAAAPLTGMLSSVTPQAMEITQQYQTLFGRAPDAEGLAYWQSQGLTGQALTNAMLSGASQQDVGTYANQNVGNIREYRMAGSGGQYGYINGLPILNASIADSVINQFDGYVSGNAADRADNAMGWDTGSVNGVLTRGAGVFGIQRSENTDDNGNVTSVSYSGDLDAAARALNLNVTNMTADEKYAAINNASQDLYLVSGKTGANDPGTYQRLGETVAVPGATTNHATVLYRKQGGALVPITETAQYFNGEMELSPGSGLSDFISFAAPIAGLALMATGAGAGLGSALLSGAGVTGASAATAGALGGAVIGGAAGALTGGNALTGAVLGGLGGYAQAGGLNDIGNTLSNAFSDITGLDTNTIRNAFTGAQTTTNAQFAAQDALTMAQNGLGTSAIQQNLIASGMDSITAATLANNAVMPGATLSSLAGSIANVPTYTNVGGMLSGGDAFATAQSEFNRLVSQGMTPEQATQAINTAGGGLGLGTVGLDSSGNLVQTAAGTAGSLLGGGNVGATTAATTAAGGGALSNLLNPSTLGNVAGGLLGAAAGIGGAAADRAALERYAAELKSAAATAAPQMQFQPIGMTTRFGSTTTPQYDANGRLIGYGYTPAADIAAQRDKLLTLSGQALPTTTNIQQATTDYYNQLQALQQPGREQQLAGIKANLQATGRAGLGLGATTGVGGSTALAATNPELAAYYNALAQTQAQQALTAQDVAQQRLNQQIATSGNLFTQAGALETAAQQPLTMGTNLGQLTTAGSTNAAKAQLEAAQLAAQLQSQGALGVNRAVTSGLTGLAPAAGGLLSQAGQYIGSLF